MVDIIFLAFIFLGVFLIAGIIPLVFVRIDLKFHKKGEIDNVWQELDGPDFDGGSLKRVEEKQPFYCKVEAYDTQGKLSRTFSRNLNAKDGIVSVTIMQYFTNRVPLLNLSRLSKVLEKNRKTVSTHGFSIDSAKYFVSIRKPFSKRGSLLCDSRLLREARPPCGSGDLTRG
jgi:hypothetical protein